MPIYPVKNIDGIKIYAASYYKDNIQKLIRAVKYHNQKELAKYQAKIMHNYWKAISANKNIYTVIPVPMFYSKARKRNYNHMDLVCEEFCKLTEYRLDKDSVIRIRETAPQYKLSKPEREKNLKNAFQLKKIIKEPVLIMDDITTTGSTLKEIIRVLNENNIYDITCFVTAIPEKESILIY
ncbi:ComF family protein [bacterium]|nr:ComF family protein [bacterium]